MTAAAETGQPLTIDDLARRVPDVHKDELEKLASAGAFANLATAHRRDALWKAGRADACERIAPRHDLEARRENCEAQRIEAGLEQWEVVRQGRQRFWGNWRARPHPRGGARPRRPRLGPNILDAERMTDLSAS